MCAVITESTPASMAALNGTSSSAFEAFPIGGDGREIHVRIHRGVAVPGKMFGGGRARNSSCRRARLR